MFSGDGYFLIKTRKNHKFVFSTEIIFCNNPKANENTHSTSSMLVYVLASISLQKYVIPATTKTAVTHSTSLVHNCY